VPVRRSFMRPSLPGRRPGQHPCQPRKPPRSALVVCGIPDAVRDRSRHGRGDLATAVRVNCAGLATDWARPPAASDLLSLGASLTTPQASRIDAGQREAATGVAHCQWLRPPSARWVWMASRCSGGIWSDRRRHSSSSWRASSRAAVSPPIWTVERRALGQRRQVVCCGAGRLSFAARMTQTAVAGVKKQSLSTP
jgi:hypothetical protein